MEKEVLKDYIDACELIKETEQDITKLKGKKKTIVQGSVKGSMKEFPFAKTHFHIEGTPYTYEDDSRLRMEEILLNRRKEDAEKVKVQVEEFMNKVPIRMQRIIRYKIFENDTWEQVATKMGRKATGESIRKELENFMKEK